ncbi:MAG TPA: putative Ig domain-containing protein [Pyrinomonadaceae bacterium]|nr:putative Ig domain-containing protein [Pyrinomonadaceae bacterium]
MTTPLSIDTEGLGGFTVGKAKYLQVQASGGTRPYTFSTPPDAWPAGITLSASGVISGTPQQAVESVTVPIRVTDSAQPQGSNTRAFNVEVTEA